MMMSLSQLVAGVHVSLIGIDENRVREIGTEVFDCLTPLQSLTTGVSGLRRITRQCCLAFSYCNPYLAFCTIIGRIVS